jgi:metal-sulfur cluster biosynthetic enzyme
MTLTAPGCQMGMMITQEIQDKLLGIPDATTRRWKSSGIRRGRRT